MAIYILLYNEYRTNSDMKIMIYVANTVSYIYRSERYSWKMKETFQLSAIVSIFYLLCYVLRISNMRNIYTLYDNCCVHCAFVLYKLYYFEIVYIYNYYNGKRATG